MRSWLKHNHIWIRRALGDLTISIKFHKPSSWRHSEVQAEAETTTYCLTLSFRLLLVKSFITYVTLMVEIISSILLDLRETTGHLKSEFASYLRFNEV
jgi:hypothetical protein